MSTSFGQPTLRGHYAGIISRAVAFVVDILVISVVMAVSTAVAVSILGFFGLGSVLARPASNIALHHIFVGVGIFAGVVWNVGYFVASWVLIGQTPGQALLGLRVVRLDHRRMTVWRAFVRYLGYWLAAIPLCLGFIWIVVDPRRQGWNDKLAGTCVVYSWEARYADATWGVKPSHRLPTGRT